MNSKLHRQLCNNWMFACTLRMSISVISGIKCGKAALFSLLLLLYLPIISQPKPFIPVEWRFTLTRITKVAMKKRTGQMTNRNGDVQPANGDFAIAYFRFTPSGRRWMWAQWLSTHYTLSIKIAHIFCWLTALCIVFM